MHDKLLSMFLENGLLQFGRFERDGEFVPLLLNLELLPSYPETLHYVVEQAAASIISPVERLVCTSDSVPLGVGVSLQTQTPLIYSRGKGEAPVHDLVGAYDVGHPAALLMNMLPPAVDLAHFVAQAQKVGLHIQSVFALVGDDAPADTPYKVNVLMSIDAMMDALEQGGQVAQGQAQTVRAWMKKGAV